MTPREIRVANTVKREAAEAGQCALSYIRVLEAGGKGDGYDDWRMDNAYQSARQAFSKAMEWTRWREGSLTYGVSR